MPSQVLPIWEGTTNVMSLDVLRAVSKSQGAALGAWVERIEAKAELALGLECQGPIPPSS